MLSRKVSAFTRVAPGNMADNMALSRPVRSPLKPRPMVSKDEVAPGRVFTSPLPGAKIPAMTRNT